MAMDANDWRVAGCLGGMAAEGAEVLGKRWAGPEDSARVADTPPDVDRDLRLRCLELAAANSELWSCTRYDPNGPYVGHDGVVAAAEAYRAFAVGPVTAAPDVDKSYGADVTKVESMAAAMVADMDGITYEHALHRVRTVWSYTIYLRYARAALDHIPYLDRYTDG